MTTQYLHTQHDHRIACMPQQGAAPGIIFLSGYGSDMTGTKAGFLAQRCQEVGLAYLRFDYRGTGQSSGVFSECTIGDWFDDTLAVFDHFTVGPQVVVGSSMGGWLGLKLALARPDRVGAVVGVAAAPDFTEELILPQLTEEQLQALATNGFVQGESDMIYTRKMLEEARNHLLLNDVIPVQCPIRLIHGANDASVPWQASFRIAELAMTDDVHVTIIKDGDHRLNRDEDLSLLWQSIIGLIG